MTSLRLILREIIRRQWREETRMSCCEFRSPVPRLLVKSASETLEPQPGATVTDRVRWFFKRPPIRNNRVLGKYCTYARTRVDLLCDKGSVLFPVTLAITTLLPVQQQQQQHRHIRRAGTRCTAL